MDPGSEEQGFISPEQFDDHLKRQVDSSCSNGCISGDKNISILHSPCRTSDLQFSLVLQTHALVLKNCMGGGGGGGGGLMFLKFLISLLK